MKKILMPVLATALILTAAPAFAEDGPKEGKKHDRFKEADKNTDGFLTKDEMLEAHKARLDKMFEKTDLDKDGKLSQEEMEKGREEMKKRWKERRAEKTEAPKE